ncbi:MAG: exodeoxyribonuclease III [Bacillota bacterium]|nr:exodeoxyribonuclease III [Bacillota bacterium]
MQKLTLLSWNVNGVRAAVKKGAMQALDMINADIVCLQEIKAKPEQIPMELLEWSGHTPFINSAERPGYSGVAVFAKQPPEQVAYGLGIERFDIEGRTLILDYPQFRLFNCYFPNGGNGEERLQYKMDFYAEVSKYALASDKPLIVCGDVNTAHQELDLARPKENSTHTGFLPMERAWIDEFLALGFIDSFRLFQQGGGYYSWWDMKTRARERNIGWRIDYFFVAEALRQNITDAYILPEVQGSDHCPVLLELEF